MKLIDAVRTHAHILPETWGDLCHLHGERFYNAWDDIYGLFNTELLQLGRYALAVQTPETGNNMVSRNTFHPEKHDIYARTSGVFDSISPEKTRGPKKRYHFNPLTMFLRPPAPLVRVGSKLFWNHTPPGPILMTKPGQTTPGNLLIMIRKNMIVGSSGQTRL